jgi:transcriptional regulator GlxA family with amidase domain
MTQDHTPLIVGILVFDGVEVLDFAGPFEVFSVTRQLRESPTTARLFQPVIIAEDQRTIRTTGDLLITPHYTIHNHPKLDMFVIPGGAGTRILQDHSPILDWIREQSGQVSLSTSVCTGALLLAFAGLLDGKEATTHWGSIERMREAFPTITVREHVRFVDQGDIVTSAGVSAGIDMALSIVTRLFGEETARQTAKDMEYDWRP